MPHVDRTPPLVPGYLLGARLGGGAAGSVWRATPLGGGPVRAVKVVRPCPGSEREIEALAAVRHPHVVTLHDSVLLDDGRTALVLDLVDGGTLGSVVAERGHLSPGEVVTVLAPLAQALAELHAVGVQHGDLAPGNVLLDRTGRPVLADLGTSRITGEPRDEVYGTAGYVDPVVLTGGPASPASDVYGLGALGWLALTGAPPPSPAQRPALAELVPTVPPALVAVVESAVDPDPSRRPDPADLARRLLLAARASPIWATGEGPDMGGLTHRIRSLAALDADTDPGRRHRAERRRLLARLRPAGREAPRGPRETQRWRPASVIAAVASAVLVAAAVGWGVPLVRDALPGHRPATRAAAAVAAGAVPTAADARLTTATPTAASPTPAIPAAPSSVTPTAAATSPTPTPTAASTAPRASPAATPRRRAAVPVDRATAVPMSVTQAQRLLSQLSQRRAAAFADPSADVGDVTVPGSPASEADSTALAALRRGGLAYRGLRLEVRVRDVRVHGDQVVVGATTTASGYEVVDRSGKVVSSVDAESPQRVRLVLARVGDGWRVRQVGA